ncbi:GumC family protein [Rhodobacter aestuarii]|nr:polysaccharide biosynthesis tyrosine autokinase [Rhodobacter aestuarii]
MRMQMSTPVQKSNLNEQDDVIDLGQILMSLRAGWKSIAISFLVAVSLGFIYVLFVATPIYTAKSVVVLDTRKPQVIDLEGMIGGLTGDSSELNTEVEVLRSRGLAKKAVAELELINDPEFNGALVPPSIIGRIRGVLSAGEQTEPSADEIEANVVSALLEHVSVRNVPSSYVFEISVQSESAEKAARIADKIAELYTLSQIETKFASMEQATAWLANRVGELKTELEVAEEKVKTFNAQTTLISSEALAAMEIQLKDLRERVEQSGAQVTSAQARVDALKAAQSPQEKRLAARDTLLDQIAEEDSAAFDSRYSQVLARAELDLARASDQKTALERSLENMTAQIARQGDDMITLQQLTREAEASRTLYEYFLSRLKETSAQQGIQQADSRLLSAAVVPTSPTAPRKSLVLAMCGILGLMAGVGIVLLREAMHNGYRTARQLEEEAGVVVMGQIPLIPAKNRPDILRYLLDKPTSAVMESIRNLRTSVLLSNVDKPPQVILMTSSIPEEGKTTNALALALNFVGVGKSVLLVEGDIRRNVLAEYFPGKSKPKGLVSLLSGQASLEDVITRDEELGFSRIMGESSNINAADLFMSEAFQNFVAQMRELFDYVIIDAPPVLVVPDARIIAQSTDAVLFTVRWNQTSRGQVQEAVQMFETVNRRISGLVLSQIDNEEMKRYGYAGKHGSYGVYGAKYYTE